MNTSKHYLSVFTLAGCLLTGIPAFAADIVVDQPWSRATPPGASTAIVYMKLTSKEGDTLVGASSSVSSDASVHEMTMDGTIMRMRPVPGGLALPPGHTVMLQPGGYHIMLTGLKAPLMKGGTVQLHLTFAKAAPLDITAPIAGIGATAPPGAPPSPAMPPMKMN